MILVLLNCTQSVVTCISYFFWDSVLIPKAILFRKDFEILLLQKYYVYNNTTISSKMARIMPVSVTRYHYLVRKKHKVTARLQYPEYLSELINISIDITFLFLYSSPIGQIVFRKKKKLWEFWRVTFLFSVILKYAKCSFYIETS